MPRLRYANTWDLNLEGGYGDLFGDAKKGSALARARVGALFIRDNNFYQIGPTVEWTSAGGKAAFGAQIEYLHLELGTWVQIGAAIDLAGRAGGMAAVGVSLFGVEAQVRKVEGLDDPAFAIYAKVRIPIGVIAYALSAK